MMTNQEAIKRIDYLKTKAECALLTSEKSWTWIYKDVQETVEACKLAIEALEKQVPKKPITETIGDYETGEIFYDSICCPNCRYEINEYNGDYMYDIQVTPVCWHCGQAIDWSEVE